MKGYFLFIYPVEYPKGGFNDWAGSFCSFEEAFEVGKASCQQNPENSFHIFDRQGNQIINSDKKVSKEFPWEFQF
ncbi:MAG: hypothetical protein AAFP92_18430 [Bacteroidota bacterium]